MEKARQLLTEEYDESVRMEVMQGWDVADLIGVRGMNSKQLWDFLSHDLESMIIEVIL